jgi:AcrR family transcriptional regulator
LKSWVHSRQISSRRERILAAAEAEFAAHGFPGARVERIAAAASVNKQLLFHYFGSKAGLHQTVCLAVASRCTIALPSGMTPAERLGSLIDQLVRYAWEYETLLSDEWLSGAVGAAIAIVEDGQRSGYFRDDADPEAVAEVVVAASFGRRRIAVEAEQVDADQSRFAVALAKMVVDHCNWR